MGLLGLRLGRDLVPAEVHRELLYGKFDNPMLGLIGAHLLLMAREPNRDTIDLVLGNLRDNLLGDVPDVRALAWRAWQRLGGDRPAPTPFDAPPMLRAGLRAVIDADAEVGGLVPADGILSWISRHQRADTAWTSWSPPVQTRARGPTCCRSNRTWCSCRPPRIWTCRRFRTTYSVQTARATGSWISRSTHSAAPMPSPGSARPSPTPPSSARWTHCATDWTG